MKYSISGFNQTKVLQITKQKTVKNKVIKLKLDIVDLTILNYIQYALASPGMKKEIKDDKCYVWIQHNKILEDLPILDIQEGMLGKRIAKLIELGLVESTIISSSNIRGSKAYYTLTSICEELIYEPDVKNYGWSQSPDVKNYGQSSEPHVKNYGSNNTLKTISKDIVLDNKVKNSSSQLEFLGSAKKLASDKKQEDIDKYVALYKKHCPSFKQIREITEVRKKNILQLLKKYDWDTIIECFDRAHSSSFMRGENNRGWKAYFDFFFKSDNFVNILEGKYDDITSKKQQSADGLITKRATKEERDARKYHF